MVKDVEVRVRQALAENLKHNTTIPRDITVTLASDVDPVALPMLSASQVLTAEDLVSIIHGQRSVPKMEAIAERPMVQGAVVDALVENGTETVVAKVVANPGAVMTTHTFLRIVDKYGRSEAVQEPLIARADLPVLVIERLVNLVSDRLRQNLFDLHRLSNDTVMNLVLATRERATIDIARGFSDAGVAALVSQLKHTGQLTGSLVLRAICMGHLHFFEHALAALAGMPLANALLLISDPNGLRNVWLKAGLSSAMLPAVRAAREAATEMEHEGRDLDAETFSRRIVERIMTQYETFGVEFERDDLEYLFTQINQLPPDAKALH